MSHVMPTFVFARKREIEIETGLTLAGFLIVDLPKGKKPKGRDRRMIAEVIEALTTAVKSGRMPDDAITYGWHGGGRPPNADEILGDDKLMSEWARTKMSIEVRVSPHHDDRIRIGPTDLRRMFSH